MSVALSIQDCPDELVAELRRRAAEQNSSLDSEVIAKLEASLRRDRPLTISELHAKAQAMGLRSPSESAAIIRHDRDAGHHR